MSTKPFTIIIRVKIASIHKLKCIQHCKLQTVPFQCQFKLNFSRWLSIILKLYQRLILSCLQHPKACCIFPEKKCIEYAVKLAGWQHLLQKICCLFLDLWSLHTIKQISEQKKKPNQSPIIWNFHFSSTYARDRLSRRWT